MKAKPTTSGGGRNGLRCNNLVQRRRSRRVSAGPEEKDFLVKLHRFMKLRETPIGRKYKEILKHYFVFSVDLYAFFNKVQKLGGYNTVTANRMWKPIYDELGGHQGSTSAATCTRRHYERSLNNNNNNNINNNNNNNNNNNDNNGNNNNCVLCHRLLLPYERSVKSDETKERRQNKSFKYASDKMSASDIQLEMIKSSSSTITSAPDNKHKEKTSSSLRSVRTKPEKSLQETSISQRPKDKENIPMSNLSETLIVEIKTDSSSENSASGKRSPELIDLASSEQDGPTPAASKVVKTSPVPALKKRKLEILKEGGLEVTAIAPGTSIGSVTIAPDRRPSVIQLAAPVVQGQVSITVTPDVSHMLGSPPTESNSAASTPSPTAGYDSSNLHRSVSVHDLKHPVLQHLYTGSLSQVHSSTPSPSSSTPDEWTPPRVTQSRSMFAHSESTVYGNPKEPYGNQKEVSGRKDTFTNQRDAYLKQREMYGNPKDANEQPGLLYRRRSYIKPSPPGCEVLDLRVNSSRKPAVSISRVTSAVPPNSASRTPVRSTPKTNGITPFPIIDGRAVVGSNLEITVVDVPKSTAPSLQQRQQQLLQQNRTLQQRRNLSIKPAPPSSRSIPRNENGRHHSLSITHVPPQRNSGQLVIPNPYLTSTSSPSSSSSSGSRKNDVSRSRQQRSNPTPPSHSSYLHSSSPAFPGYLSQLSPASGSSGSSSSSKNTSPYLSLLDPMYYSSLYGSHGMYPPNVAAAAAAAFLSPLQVATASPLFAPSSEQLQLYKDLMSHHHNNMRFTQSAGSLLGLPRDGSTSITPVGRSTPTTK
ncbi:hypothetical protein C0J52_03300 [Blattella germanica]|nr:hypothetical protein C0J52_03300 [Blattella germanica]